jgi:hypothetical protein
MSAAMDDRNRTTMTSDDLLALAVEILETRGVVDELLDAARAFDGDPHEELFACVVAMEELPEVDVADSAYVAAIHIVYRDG